MKTPLDTQLNPTTTPPAAMDASSIARSVLLAREALDFGAEHLSHDITERLRAARVRALTAPTQKTAPAKQANFNFGQWFNHLSGWLRGAIAASTVAIAFVLTFGTTQSDLGNLPTKADTVASAQPNSVVDTLPSVSSAPTSQTLMSNTVATNQSNANRANPNSTLRSTARSAAPESAPMTSVATAAVNPNAEDEQIDIILREKIPLQAYLNDDFNQYANRQGVRSAGSADQ